MHSSDSRGTIIRRGNVWRINNALVEEVSAGNTRQTGRLLISYALKDPRGRIEFLQLNAGRDTAISNQWGQPMGLSQIRPGMWIDAGFSPAMTRSVPPQTNAYYIIVRRNPKPPSGSITTDRIAEMGTGFIITGNTFDINRQTRFNVSGETEILNRNGRRIPLGALRPGQLVRITHADFMTLSIPPQTAAYRIQVV